jgi:hypothetical protein
MESIYLWAFGDEKSIAAPAMTGSEAFFNNLLEQAFQETYGLNLKDLLPDEEKALGSYRHAVSQLIPKATRVAWSLVSAMVSAANTSTKYFVYYGYSTELSSFWKRKKDDLILVIIGGLLGGLILELVVSHFSKK